jgi:hypothetical protein
VSLLPAAPLDMQTAVRSIWWLRPQGFLFNPLRVTSDICCVGTPALRTADVSFMRSAIEMSVVG